MPKAVQYVVDMGNKGKPTASIFVDPTIPLPKELPDNCTEKQRAIAEFAAMLQLDKCKEKNGNLYLRNWYKIQELYPDSASFFEEHNEWYIAEREKRLKQLQEKLSQEFIAMTEEDKKKIVRIYYELKKRWINVE